MTNVEAINTQVYSPYSVFGSITKGVALGSIAGYAAKHMLPLTNAEMDDEYKTVIAEIKEQAKKTKGLPIEAIRNLESRTPAQDVFLKLVDAEPIKDKGIISAIVNALSKKEKASDEAVNRVARAFSMKNIIANSGLDAEGKKELTNIVAQVNQKATRSTKQYIKAYNSTVKALKRPTIAFVTMGAVAGFFGGLAHKVISDMRA